MLTFKGTLMRGPKLSRNVAAAGVSSSARRLQLNLEI